MQDRVLILLSCSHDKRRGGAAFDPSSRTICSETILPDTRARVLTTRQKIRQFLRGGPPRLYNEDQSGGYRDDRKCNRALCKGPDFAGNEHCTNGYLPAFKRYSGRFFDELERQSPEFWVELAGRPVEIMFVSGLYGLLFWDEAIQEYDCHSRDCTNDHKKQTVGEIWGSTLTEGLREFIRSGSRTTPFRRVYDLLSDSSYQQLFDWGKVASSGARVFHRIFKEIAGPDVLPKLARVLSERLDHFSFGLEQFQRNKWYMLEDGTEFSFEFPIGDNRLALREGDIRAAQEEILKDRAELNKLPPYVLNMLVLAEHSFARVRSIETFDFGTVVVSFSKPVEAYFRNVVPGTSHRASIHEIASKLKGRREWFDVCSQLRQLGDLRGRGAHPGSTTRQDLTTARSLSLNILSRAVQLIGLKREDSYR